jgi:hypothetical protein
MKHIIRTTTTLVVLASLATMATANNQHKHKAKPKAQEEQTISQVSGEVVPMVGTWTLRNGDTPRTDIKMLFRSNGTFAFIGPNWQSAGKFRLADHKLSLEWTSVDGSKVAPGTVKKDYAMNEDDSSFKIDTYTYYKLQR